MICSRCGHTDIPKATSNCPNCGFVFKSASRLTSTASFRALSARRKMLTSRQYSMPFALGEDAFGEYVIRDLLGQGPLGVVYLATNDRGDQFALKVLHKRWRTEVDLDQLNGTYQRLDEFEEGTRLNLPTRVLVQDEYLGLSASYLEGLTVRKLMNLRKNTSKAFRLDELNQLVHGIATPLKTFHHDGIIHGGLKPENFFVTSDAEQKQVVTLSDACLSTGLGIEAYYKAQRAAGVGHYCAPELSENKMSLASDVYSLGVFIFEGITGQAYQTKKSITEIIPAQGIEPLEDLMTRALHPEPDQRYRDVNALLSAYEDVAKHLDSLEGSPFNSEGTQPRNESVVTKFSLTNMAKLDEKSDPLFSESPQGEDKLPPPLPVETTEKTPPPLPSLPQQSKRNLIGGNAPLFPLHETPPPNIDLLSQVGEARDSIPSLDAISHNENLKFDSMKTPLSITVGAPQSRPIPIQTKNSNRQIWLGAVATVFVALAVYMLLDQTPVPNTPIEVAIKLPLEAGQTKLIQKDGISKKVDQATVSSTQGKVGDERTTEQTEVEATVKKAEVEAAAIKKAEAEAAAIKKAEAKAAAVAIKKAEAKAAAASKKAEAKAAARKAKTTAEKAEANTKKAKAKADAKKAKADAKKANADAKSARLAARQEAQAEAKAKKAEELVARQEAQAKRAAELAARTEAKSKAKAEKKAQLAAQKAAEAKQKSNQSSSSLKTKTKAESKAVVVPEKVQKQDDAKVLSCPGGMILKRTARFPRGSVRRGKIKGKRAIQLARNGKAYCIDAYEYPGRGQKPKVNITFNGAKSLCEQAGKRLCSGNEWVRACKGRGNASYPYGKRFNANKCITVDKEDEERRRSASGSMRSCKSASGAYDMSGNVAEWTSDQRVRGGYYASYDDEATCKSGGRRAPSSKRGYIGFRCCMDFKK